jgi:hypothetical protein
MPGLAGRVYTTLTNMVATAALPPVLRAQYGTLLPAGGPMQRLGAVAGPAVLSRLPDRIRLDPLAAIAIQRAGRRYVAQRCRIP